MTNILTELTLINIDNKKNKSSRCGRRKVQVVHSKDVTMEEINLNSEIAFWQVDLPLGKPLDPIAAEFNSIFHDLQNNSSHFKAREDERYATADANGKALLELDGKSVPYFVDQNKKFNMQVGDTEKKGRTYCYDRSKRQNKNHKRKMKANDLVFPSMDDVKKGDDEEKVEMALSVEDHRPINALLEESENPVSVDIVSNEDATDFCVDYSLKEIKEIIGAAI